jgi:two-component system, OmpR family, sensor kinase
MTLRLRILLVAITLTLLGLLVAAGATYFLLGSFLTSRVDEQLETASRPIAAILLSDVDEEVLDRLPGESARRSFIPDGTYGALLDGDGRVLADLHFDFGEETSPRPQLPEAFGRVEAEPVVATTGAMDGSTRFRMMARRLSDSRSVVVAIPLTEVQATQHRLLLIEAAVSALVLLTIAAAALFLVRLELRPLEQMGETAGAIAAGELSRRVAPDDTRTEVGRLGAALNEMLAQIEHAFAERTATEERLRQFVADASHELRTPITSIRGYAELFRRGAAERPDDLAKTMRRIEEEGARMGTLVDELLLLAQLDQGLPLRQEIVDLREVVLAAADAARIADPERPLDVESPGPVDVVGDDLRLRQVLDNLLANARTHTPSGTPIHVHVVVTDGAAVLEVADEGPGIAPADAERIFERFYRADRSRSRPLGGAGLGLAVARSLVEAHGGVLTYGQRPGGGAVFRITLPAAADEGANPDINGRGRRPDRPSRKRLPELQEPGSRS